MATATKPIFVGAGALAPEGVPDGSRPPTGVRGVLPRDWTGSDGKLLSRQFEALQGVARRHGVTPLSASMDYRPIPEELIEDAEALEGFADGWDEWFLSAVGARAVEELVTRWVADRPGRRDPDHAAVGRQLRQLAECLRRAERQGAGFA
jgi:hypothetical protein